MSERVESLLVELIEALQEQTRAVQALASSNQALVQAMAEMEGVEDEDAQPTTYLDGSPCR